MNLLFVSSAQYPNGTASSNRHMALARGLAGLGHSVRFLAVYPQSHDYGPGQTFEHNSVIYENLAPGREDGAPLLKKATYWISVIGETKKRISDLHRSLKLDAVILLDFESWFLFRLIAHCKREGIAIFHERTEYPAVVAKKDLPGKIYLQLYLRHYIRQFNGIYVISDALKKYFQGLTKHHVPVETINMVVEPDRFQHRAASPVNGEYIAYTGTMDAAKDGVEILINAFVYVAHKYQQIKLVLIGPFPSPEQEGRLKELVRKNQLEQRVIFTGRVGRDEIPSWLVNARLLVLARPDNPQARGGFPTKLGEYLATGKPVVVTRVGEIDRFLTDGLNAFLAEPGNTSMLAEKIVTALEDPVKAASIGHNGTRLAEDAFNYKVQAAKLATFISSSHE